MTTTSFHLDPPPGFRPFDPRAAITVYERRLPHWRQGGATYFVTFRLADSLPKEKIDLFTSLRHEWESILKARQEVEKWDESTKKQAWEDLSRHAFVTIETWLDRGSGKCSFRALENQKMTREALDHADGAEYQIGAGVIMPNHIHLLVRPLETHSLEKILQSRKRRIAREINCRSGTLGSLWQEESFDRIVRDAEHLWRCLQYIGRNHNKAGLVGNKTTKWVNQDWIEAGWGFSE